MKKSKMSITALSIVAFLTILLLGLPAPSSAQEDTTPPFVLSVSPPDGAIGVALNLRNVFVRFNEEMDPATLNPSNIFLTDPQGNTVPISTYTPNSPSPGIWFAQLFEPNTTYTVHVTIGVTDVAGNHLAEEFISTFTTEEALVDPDPPFVLSVSPPDGAIGVALNLRNVFVRFNEEMDPATLNPSNIFLTDPQGNTVPISTYTPNSPSPGIWFAQLFEPNTTYTVHVTIGVTDVAGNHLAEEFISTFTTAGMAQDTTPPELIEFDFTPKSIDVGDGPQDVTLTFRITDDLSGVQAASVVFDSPSGQQSRGLSIDASERISGDEYDGIYQGTITFPELSETGKWHVQGGVFLVDSIGNIRNYSDAEIIAMGFPTELIVESIIDTDGDGIPNDEDACPSSDLSGTVVIDGCDSGVENVLLEDGCTISDLILECAGNAKNHGKFVSSVSHMSNYLKKKGTISGKEKGKIQKCAAKANIP